MKSVEQQVVEQIAIALQKMNADSALQSVVASIGDTLTFEEALPLLVEFNTSGDYFIHRLADC